jgi:hypothetical protein
MSRRDDADARAHASRRSSPAGASPASVSAGAPSSRPQTREETHAGQAWCQEPLRREPVRGPQHHVKLAASSHSQPERRAGHGAAKTMSRAPQSGDARARELGGVRSAARGHGDERNTRGPSAQPGSGRRHSYKPPAKASAGQRESEGTIVVTSRATNNARGAKGPCGGNVGRASTREGMTGRTSSTPPVDACPPTKCASCNADCGVRPSGNRADASMHYWTASTGMTPCGKHGRGCLSARATLLGYHVFHLEHVGERRTKSVRPGDNRQRLLAHLAGRAKQHALVDLRQVRNEAPPHAATSTIAAERRFSKDSFARLHEQILVTVQRVSRFGSSDATPFRRR